MLERVTASALYNAADAGYEQAARADVARVDPLLRRTINKRLRRAIDDGIELTGPVDDVVDEQQQLRVAYLLFVEKLGDVEPRSKDAVAAAFAKAAESAPKKAPRLWFVTPLVLLLVLGGGGLAGYQLFGPSPEQRMRRSALGQALGNDLTKWVVSLDRYRRARDGFRGVDGKLNKLEEHKSALLASTKEALGEPGEKAFTAILDAGEKIDGSGRPEGLAPDAKVEPDFVPDDEKALFDATRGMNELLAQEGKPVVLDARTSLTSIHGGGDLGGLVPFREVIVVSYFVERTGTLRYRGGDTPVTLGKRLDNLNVAIAGDAYDTKALGGMLVSLDLAEETLTGGLMTPLAGTAPWELVPAKEAALMEGGEEMIDRAGQVLREELLGSAGVERESATRIADLLDQRREMVNKLTDLDVPSPRKLLLDDESIEKLEHFREENLEVFQVLELNEKLQGYEGDFKRILLTFADAATIRGVVYLLEKKETEVPEALAAVLAELPEGYRDPEHPRRQLFADLAAIASSETIAKTLLSLVVRSLLLSSGRFVTPGPRVLVSEMAGALGVTPSDPWIENGRISKRFPALYKALMEKSSAEVKAAALSVFKELAKSEPPELSWP